MQQQNLQSSGYFHESGLLDPEQYEHEYLSNMRFALKAGPCSPRELLSPWEDNKLRHSRKQQLLGGDRFEEMHRPSLAQTDRAGKFRSIFDFGDMNKTKRNFRNIASKIDNKWDGYSNTLDKDAYNTHRKSSIHRQVKLPKPLTAKMIEMETPQALPLSLDRKKFKSPNKLSGKKHLIQNIDYREIQQSMFHKPTAANRFDEFCKKLQSKPLLTPQTCPSDRIRVINFPITQDEDQQRQSIKKRQEKERQFRNVKHSFTNSFYMRNKLHRQKRLSEVGFVDTPMPDKPLDFRELLNEKNQLKIMNSKKRKSRIFSMVLRI